MRVDVNGVRGYVDRFVHGFTEATPIKEDSRQESSEENMVAFKEMARQSLEHLYGKEMLMCIVELNRKSNHLVLSQTLFTEVVHLDDFDIGKVYTGLVYAIDSTYIKLYLQGIVGWLPAEQRLPDQDVLLDLRNIVHIGQEIGVRVTKKRERSLWLVLESLSSEG